MKNHEKGFIGAGWGCATAYNKNVSGSAGFARSTYMALLTNVARKRGAAYSRSDRPTTIRGGHVGNV